jgi:hypothetical protein
MPNQIKKSSPLTIALAWLVVLIPAGWGIYNTALKAANLFR